MDTALLKRLAELVATRNTVSKRITELTGRPAQIGHLGELIASEVFDIAVESSAVNKGFDGRFRSGPYADRTVDIKWYAKNEGMIDLRVYDLPDFYLVLTGPLGSTMTSRGDDRPWMIDAVYIFEARPLIDALMRRHCRIGVATSVMQEFWQAAQVYPSSGSGPLVLKREQCVVLAMFGSS